MMETASLIQFMSAHTTLAPVIAAALAAAETFAFLSVFVPSTLLLMAVGAAASTGAFPFMPIWAGATIGAMIGSTFSYWLGRVYGDRILAMWPLRDHPAGVARTREAFSRWGGLALVAGHFIGPLRPVVFLFAGLSGMRFWPFTLFNLFGAMAWAFAIPMTGLVGGDILGWLWHFTGL